MSVNIDLLKIPYTTVNVSLLFIIYTSSATHDNITTAPTSHGNTSTPLATCEHTRKMYPQATLPYRSRTYGKKHQQKAHR